MNSRRSRLSFPVLFLVLFPLWSQAGQIKFKRKLEQGEEVFSQRRSILFKRMQIVRGCDYQRNVLVYLVYTDKIIEGSPENSTSSVPIAPWGETTAPAKCSDWISG